MERGRERVGHTKYWCELLWDAIKDGARINVKATTVLSKVVAGKLLWER
jgi:hypothetical protein